MPAAPEGFIAQWIETDMDEDYYTVRFFWEDKSTNETSFALAIKEYTNSSTAFNKVTSAASLTAGVYYRLNLLMNHQLQQLKILVISAILEVLCMLVVQNFL